MSSTRSNTSERERSAISEKLWWICGEAVPRDEVVFFTQTIILYVVILMCLINLSIGTEFHTVFVGLLSSSLGYMLPNPTLGRRGTFDEIVCGKRNLINPTEECTEVVSNENVDEESSGILNTSIGSTNN